MRPGIPLGTGNSSPLPLIMAQPANASSPPVTKEGQETALAALQTSCNHHGPPIPCQEEPWNYSAGDKAELAPSLTLLLGDSPGDAEFMHLVWREMGRGFGLCCSHCGFMPFLSGCFSFSLGLTRKPLLDLKHVLQGSFIRTSGKFHL